MNSGNGHEAALRLWSDEPAEVDLLAFGAVADTVIDAVLDDSLDPLALGLSGAWGSGKTTVLHLVQASLATGDISDSDMSVLTLLTVPWRYDPAVGAKQSLIGEVLACLEQALTDDAADDSALTKVRSLIGRVDWAKALQMAARTSLTLQLPSVDDLPGLVRSRNEEDTDDAPRTLESFRREFSELMEGPSFEHVKRLVVLVDDLDRCLPETVVETLETIRLFLAVPKMAFVIAADEARVADAISRHYRNEGLPSGSGAQLGGSEQPARLYLHKMVQTTVPIPGLSRFDTQAYLFLLQVLNDCESDQLADLVNQCERLRRDSGSLGAIEADNIDVSEALEFAERLTPILYEKLQGNPRRIKRFLNDLHVRQSVAKRRGIVLNAAIIAKLMVLETILTEGFEEVLDWFAKNQLRERIKALEAAIAPQDEEDASGTSQDVVDKASAVRGDSDGEHSPEEDFVPELLRWATLAPPLASEDLGPYLYLAAAFSGTALLDAGLPEHLRDLAASLLSSVRAIQKSVTPGHLAALPPADADALIRHLATAARDRPVDQTAAINGLLVTVAGHPEAVPRASKLLSAIPADELEPASALLFRGANANVFREVLETWHDSTSQESVRAALKMALEG